MRPREDAQQEWLDVLFASRNKAYGAYDLRQAYGRHYLRAAVFTIGLSVLCALGYILQKVLFPPAPEPITKPVIAQFTELPPPPSVKPPPRIELPKSQPGGSQGGSPPAPTLKPTIRFVPPVVRRDEEVKDEEPPPSITELRKNEVSDQTRKGDSLAVWAHSGNGNGLGDGNGKGDGNGNGDGNGTGDGNGNGTPSAPDVRIPLKLVRIVTPEYPEAARSKNIKARVNVEVTVDEAGKVTLARIIKRSLLSKNGEETSIPRLEYGLEDAALSAANRHLFRPARLNGKAIPSTYVLDFSFGI